MDKADRFIAYHEATDILSDAEVKLDQAYDRRGTAYHKYANASGSKKEKLRLEFKKFYDAYDDAIIARDTATIVRNHAYNTYMKD
jgi:DnaJ-class molecular chaperone